MLNKLHKICQGLIKFSRWFIAKPLQYLGCHKRCLSVAAVILIVFFALNRLDLPVKAKKEVAGNKWWQGDNGLIEETAESLNLALLNSGMDLLSPVIPAAQASVDLSIDDEQENQDLLNMESAGLLTAGLVGNPFIGMQKEPVNYIVQQGDSPFSIALKFGVTTETVLAANSLTEYGLIKPGQQLVILPINGVRIKVGAKDTIASLAKKYKGKEDEIKVFNGIYDDGKLVVGEFIIIPDGELPTPTVIRPKVTAPKYAKDTIASGWLILPTTGKDWGKIHGQNGVDVANACGTPIYAAAAGTVTLSDGIGWNYGYGKYIMIKHLNGVVTLYSHNSQLLVNQGEAVAQGQLIALMGTTGRSSGCHLHFEVRGAKNPLVGAKTIR